MKLTKAELEYYATAKPRTVMAPGYFKDGELRLRTIYYAYLGKKCVGYADGFQSYSKDAGAYTLRSEALAGAKMFKSEMLRRLEAGDFRELDVVN